MKTRRSLRLESKIQTLLFSKSNNDNTIVPESPLSLNGTHQPPFKCVAVSVLETPEDGQGLCKKSKIKVSRTENSFDQSDLPEPALIETTPNLKLSKRKDIEEILETDFLYCNSPNNNSKPSSSTPNRYKNDNRFVERSGHRKSTEVLFPFKLNGKELLTKKDSRTGKKLSKISKSLRQSRGGGGNCSFQDEVNILRDGSSSEQMSLSSFNISNHKILNKSSNTFGESDVNRNMTTLSFEDSSLDLTPANCNNEILIQKRMSDFRCFETDNGKENQSLNYLPNGLSNSIFQIAYKNSQTPCNKLKETSHGALDDENLNLKRILEGELSPLNKSLFKLQESLSPTQPATLLILQGVIAYVDVRCGAENRSKAFQEVLEYLGAIVSEKFTSEVTHVIFREGSKVTIQKASQRDVYLVSPLWVDACRVKMVQVSEALFPISNEYQKKFSLEFGNAVFPRKLKSMQPRKFEDDILIAEAKLRRKRKMQNEPPDKPNDVAGPSMPLKRSSKDTNCPLYGIAHLLTPVRGADVPLNISNSSQSSAEDCHTPLATRMYNKFFSPLPNPLLKSSSERIIQVSPLSNECNEQGLTSDLSVVSQNKKLSLDSSDNSVFEENSEVPQQLFCQKPGVNCNVPTASRMVENNLTPSTSNINKVILEVKKLDINGGKNNEIPKYPRRSKRLSTVYKNISCDDSMNKKNLSDENPKTKNLSSQPNCSNSSVTLLKKRKLHSVDVVEPSQDLITPCTPPIALQQRNVEIYETVKKQYISQRKELQKSFNSKDKKDLSILPLPRTLKRQSNYSSGSSTKNKNNSDLPPISESSKDLPPRKGRFSLCPRKRNSFEEFVPKSNFQRSSKRITSYKDSLPCICLTSFHSSNIGSIYAIIKSLGGFHTTTEVNEYTTHIVCGAERRTINVLLGISKGCWVLDVSWLYESVELLRWAPEEPFELFNFCPGTKISRTLRFSKPKVFEPLLFKKFGRIYISKSCSPPAYLIQDLLLNCGAHVCSTIRSADLIISTEKMNTGVKQVNPRWLFDSIQYWEAKDLQEYLL